MNKIFYFLSLGLLVSLASCGEEYPWTGSKTEGGIKIKFSSDSGVECGTRAVDNVSPVVPEESEFSVSLTKVDGSYQNDWNDIESFNKEEGFPIGDYNIAVSYGDIDTEGFRSPYYLGETSVHVSPGDVSDASVTAKLANSMVSIRYTDEFKSMFKSYSASIQSEGHEWLTFKQNETKPAYVAPSEVKVGLTLTNANDENQEVTIVPSSFTAKARHHHIVTVGVNQDSSTGTAVLDIQFEDNVVSETISISLGDDLFNSPAPEVKAIGFTEDGLNIFEYAAFKDKAQFDVFAFGGMQSATLQVTAADGGATPVFGNSVDLVGADSRLQSQLATAGLECSGFFHNIGQMGVVNLVGFITNLPHGTYNVSLQVQDALTRVSDPVSLTVRISEVGIEVLPVTPSFFDENLVVDVSTNCPDIKNVMKFQATNANGSLADAEIIDVEDISASEGSYTYRYKLGVSQITKKTIELQASCGEKEINKTLTVNAPKINIVSDAFARKVVLNITGDDGVDGPHTKYIRDNIDLYNGDKKISENNITVGADGYITITGLTQKNKYNYKVKLDEYYTPISEFTTEAETQLLNSNFSELGTQYKFDKIQCGGIWAIRGSSWYQYINYTNINIYDPQYWESINHETCYSGSDPKNTWFVVPSTYVENGAVTIRSVGYSHKGTVPDESTSGSKYYCTNSPSKDQLSKAAGKLLYDSGKQNSPNDLFNSRPSNISFYYSYNSVKNEKATVSIKVFGEDKSTILSEKTVKLVHKDNIDDIYKISLPSYPFGKAAGGILVEFVSSDAATPDIIIPQGAELDEGVTYKLGRKENWVNNNSNEANKYKTFAKGSELVISNVELGYE